jgi:nickel-type superoxide dismutase maturation protease
MENELPAAGWLEKAAYLCGFREIFVIDGDSMLPTLKPGERVLIDPGGPFEVGAVVLARHPFRRGLRIVKRIREITPEGRYFLVGDNAPESTDSRSFGTLAAKDILGRAVCRVK